MPPFAAGAQPGRQSSQTRAASRPESRHRVGLSPIRKRAERLAQRLNQALAEGDRLLQAELIWRPKPIQTWSKLASSITICRSLHHRKKAESVSHLAVTQSRWSKGRRRELCPSSRITAAESACGFGAASDGAAGSSGLFYLEPRRRKWKTGSAKWSRRCSRSECHSG